MRDWLCRKVKAKASYMQSRKYEKAPQFKPLTEICFEAPSLHRIFMILKKQKFSV